MILLFYSLLILLIIKIDNIHSTELYKVKSNQNRSSNYAEISLNSSSSISIDQVIFSHNKLLQTCGTWIDSYRELHPKLLKGIHGHKKGILFSYPLLSGIADRFLGISTIFMYSLVLNRAFQIARRTDDLLLGFEHGFNNRYIDWQRPKDFDITHFQDYFEIPNYQANDSVSIYETMYASLNRGMSNQILTEG